MDALNRLAEYVKSLEEKIHALENANREKEEMLRRLVAEIPAGDRKLERIAAQYLSSLSAGGKTTTTSIASAAVVNTAGATPLPVQDQQLTGVRWPSNVVRKKFVDFFVERGHRNWKSSPVVPWHDPTLLFTNSGMNQFKPLFLGQADPTTELSKLKRACNTQKCIRAGGKHNDLDDVGKDVYHHTFFEMLGNWSFGDYFKKEAIAWAWELLTREYGIDPNRLYATYFEGNDKVPADLEARDIWSQYLPPGRILPYGAKENFWEMGPTGPCGPCTEIHYDRIGGGRDAAKLVNADDPNVIEIWNNVFIQYNRNELGGLDPLPNKHVDTGMGFERLVSVLQDKRSNYDTDVFTPLFRALEARSHVRPYEGKVGKDDVGLIDTAYRIVVDHLRTLSFAVADGCEPSNEGRGYVLRRILRRAVRYGLETLKCEKGFFSSMVPVLAEHVKDTFPEVSEKMERVKSILASEERDFSRTIEKGRAFFSKTEERLRAEGKTEIPGTDAFYMYSTMGFPVDLTEIMAHEVGMTVDKKGFEQAMQEFKQLSMDAAAAHALAGNAEQEGVVPKLDVFATDELEKNLKIPPTVAEPGKLAYDAAPAPRARVLAIYDPKRRVFITDTSDAGSKGQRTFGIVLDRTNFYHEAGGQVADEGAITTDSDGGGVFQVMDVQSSKGYVVHAGVVKSGRIVVGSEVACLVDVERRKQAAANHTSTHMLNHSLRKVLARESPPEQKGSLVTPEKLRFDFDSREPIPVKDLKAIEEATVEQIAKGLPVYAQVVPLAQAMAISSLRAVFGETYPDPVRVVSVGVPVEELLKDPTRSEWMASSIELCGGSHLTNSREAQDFVIEREEGIAKGVRRITALTGEAARSARSLGKEYAARIAKLEALDSLDERDAAQKEMRVELEAASLSCVVKAELRARLDAIQKSVFERVKEAEKDAINAKAENVLLPSNSRTKTLLEGKLLIHDVDPTAAPPATKLVELSKIATKVGGEVAKRSGAAVVLINREGEEFQANLCVPDSLKATLPANEWLKSITPPVKGGGSATAAMFKAEIGRLDEILRQCETIASGKLK